MAQRYREGVVQQAGGNSPLAARSVDLIRNYSEAMSAHEIHAAMERIGEFVTACNAYIEIAAPWKLAKDAERAEALDHALFVLAEALRIIAILISPVMPKAAAEILHQLNFKGEYMLTDASWGGLPAKHELGKPVPLFPRIEGRGD